MRDSAELMEEVRLAWQVNNRVNLKLIDRISDAGMQCTLSKRGGRNVVRQFAHIHNNRVFHLEGRAKVLAKGVRKFASKEEPGKRELKAALTDSCRRIDELFRMGCADMKGVRLFKRGVVPYLAYFVAHEGHHRGNILLTLKQCGHPVESATRSGIWDWDRI
jgi:uncharacterized damage-inducible protein DinB